MPFHVGDAGPSTIAAGTLVQALDALPDGVLILDNEWNVAFVNRAGAALLRRPVAELLGRNLWVALPDLGGSNFHSFLLHARAVGSTVTWAGCCAPAGRWVQATAVVTGDLLQVSFRAPEPPQEGAAHVDDRAESVRDAPDGDQDRLRFLAEVSEAMIATLNTGESASQMAELVVGRLCDWAVVALAGENGEVGEEAWAHREPSRRRDLDIYMTGRLRGTGDDAAMIDALLTGQPVQVREIREDLVAASLPTEAVRRAWRRLDTSSCTIVPLRARGATFGALAMLNAAGRPPHNDVQIAIAVEVARRGALALDNARLYGRQLTVAEKLQRSLLTDPPQPDDLELVVRYRPATTHMHIGGDWYDAFQADGALLAVIGDVVGHDVDAAAAMGQIRSILRGVAYDRADTPDRILARVDSVLTGLKMDSLATALVARVEQPPAQRRAGLRTLRWSSAGHLPPLLVQPDGTVELLATPPERLLGIDQPVTRTDHETTLHPGSTLLLFTDGLVEQGHTCLDDGIAKLADVLASVHGLPLDQLSDRVLDHMLPCRGDDDVALLAVRCHPQPAVA
jgi:phosphoserine phosphatase RsbU/P